MSNGLSKADQTYLSAQQQAQIKALKKAWADANAAGDQAAMTRANQEAEAIRATAGYAGGSDGSGYTRLDGGTAIAGAGQSAADVQKWVDNYKYTNLDEQRGWVNGFSGDMNQRSMANYIRQQMLANSNAWAGADEAGKAYLHDQNLQLAKILSDAVGGAQSYYNEELGRWETDNANLGYGYDTGQFNDPDWYRNYYGMTDEQVEAYKSDTSRYSNYVDQRTIRNWIDDSSGYTGVYAQFVNGPYTRLLQGDNGVPRSLYIDVEGDGEGWENFSPKKNADGTILPQSPYLKYNNDMTEYTRSKSSYVDENGVIQPGLYLQTNPAGNRTSGHDLMLWSGASGDSTLDQWKSAAEQQAVAVRDHAVDRAVQQLLDAEAAAQGQFQTQRDQIAREERNALDNSALYAETRGDRGGIGQAQYNQIQAQAAANRQAVSSAQTQLAADTARQVAQLRADGEFEKADDLLEISQTYLLKLLELEQWAAEYQLDQAKFLASLDEWQQEFLMKASNALI